MTATPQTLFPAGPTARRTDLDTSAAAVPSAQYLSAMQAEVLELHRRHPDGLTDDEVVARLADQVHGTRGSHRNAGTLVKRATELRHAGMLTDSGRRRPTRTGRLAVVWTARPPAAT